LQLRSDADFNINEVILAPNPYDPDKGPAHIGFVLSLPAVVKVNIHRISGEKLWSGEGSFGSGYNEILWDGSSAYENRVGNGFYIGYVSAEPAGGGRKTKLIKIAVLR
jgi:hypothetical protein